MEYLVQVETLQEGYLSFPCEGYSLEEFETLDAYDREMIIKRNVSLVEIQINDFWLVKEPHEN